MKLEEKRVKGDVVYQGKILKLVKDEVSLPDGSLSVREIVRHSGGAAVLFINEGKVALVRQFRYAYAKEIYEIPAGKMEAGEDPLASSARELEEETGYRALDMRHFLDVYPSPGYTDEVIHIYLVTRAEFIGKRPDEGEFLENYFMPLEEVVQRIESGEITDAKTVCAVYKYLAENKN